MWARLRAAGGTAVDAQWDSPFLRSLGALPMARERYLELLDRPAEPIRLAHPLATRTTGLLPPPLSRRGSQTPRWHQAPRVVRAGAW